MGSCLSCLGAADQQQTATQSAPPQSFANVVASAAVHAVADIISGDQPTASAHHSPPPGTSVIKDAYVFKVPDGDTFSCDYYDANGEKVTGRVRIMGIDCPETKQNYGPEAGQIGEQMLLRTKVTLFVHTTDRYGRMVADVITANGINYGEEILRRGAAWHYKAYDKRPHLAQLENEARAQKIGLWAYARPQEPWEYRRRRREQREG